jgi:hypothetical protein
MNIKLTLSVDKTVIEQAKEYAQSKGVSLSVIIENYLKLSLQNKSEKTVDAGDDVQISERVRALRGSVKLPDDFDGDYSRLIDEYRTEKWLS